MKKNHLHEQYAKSKENSGYDLSRDLVKKLEKKNKKKSCNVILILANKKMFKILKQM